MNTLCIPQCVLTWGFLCQLVCSIPHFMAVVDVGHMFKDLINYIVYLLRQGSSGGRGCHRPHCTVSEALKAIGTAL